jgi:hypothetical protein
MLEKKRRGARLHGGGWDGYLDEMGYVRSLSWRLTESTRMPSFLRSVPLKEGANRMPLRTRDPIATGLA